MGSNFTGVETELARRIISDGAVRHLILTGVPSGEGGTRAFWYLRGLRGGPLKARSQCNDASPGHHIGQISKKHVAHTGRSENSKVLERSRMYRFSQPRSLDDRPETDCLQYSKTNNRAAAAAARYRFGVRAVEAGQSVGQLVWASGTAETSCSGLEAVLTSCILLYGATLPARRNASSIRL